MTVAATTPVPHAPAATVVPRSGFWSLAGLLALVGFGKAVQADTMDPDAFWHFRVADQLLRDGVGPLIDSISFASLKTPWTPYSWLAELFMRGVWNFGGFQLATLVTGLSSAAIVLLIAASARRRVNAGNDVAVAVLTAGAAFFVLPFISFRPVTFALVLLSAVAWLLVRDREKPTATTWLIVPLTALLTNLHLYSVIAVALAFATVAGTWLDDRRQFRRRLLIAAATVAAACLTPMLPGMIETALKYNADDPMVASPFITEMRPFYTGGSGKVSLVLFVLAAGMCLWRRASLSATDWLWLALGTVLLFRLGRFAPVFAILATPAVTRAFPAMGDRALRRPIVRVALLAVLAAGVANLLPAFYERDLDRWLNRHHPTYPTAAATFVDERVTPRTGRLINEFNWGGYLAWRLGDRYRVLMDGRTQLYEPAFWRATHLGDAASRRELMSNITADAAVLPTDGSALADPLIGLGWREAYRDDLARVLVPGQ